MSFHIVQKPTPHNYSKGADRINYDVTDKYCPRPFMGGNENVYHGVSGNVMWERFKNLLRNKQ